MPLPRTAICERLACRLPLFAFTRSPATVVALARAGGFGVLGAISYTNEELEAHLAWIDAHIEGLPYGVDVVMPASYQGAGQDLDEAAFRAMIPAAHRHFVEDLLAANGVPPLPDEVATRHALLSWVHEKSREQVDIALAHPIRFLANALGPPPEDVVAKAHARGVLVGALCGTVQHARSHVAMGVDVVIAQGTEAGGHTGDVATMVLVPEVVRALPDVPVLAAGGIGTGEQVVAALALGAQGAWTGSIWLTVQEDVSPAVLREKLLRASSGDTVRSRSLTGKPARQLRTAWTEAWDGKASPGTLPMPLQFMVTNEALTRILHHAGEGHEGAGRLAGSPVGQVVGLMNDVPTVSELVARIEREAEAALARLGRAA